MTSFFDSSKETDFSPLFKNKANQTLKIEKNQITFQGYLQKQGKILKFWNKRYYIIVGGKLFYKKKENSKIIKGELDLTNLLYEKYDNESEEKSNLFIKEKSKLNTNGLFRYTITFKRSINKKITLATQSEDTFYEFIECLKPYCICLNFKIDYSVVKIIGKGNFAKVFLAYNNKSQKRVALKGFSKKILNAQTNGKKNLINEINILRMMNHENIVKLHEVYETETSIYLVLDLLEGGELFQRIPFMNNYEDTDIKTLMKNLLNALAHMHEKGVMHRDIKPDNILLESAKNDYDIRIADFGLATIINDSEILYKRCGTPGFIAPEVISYKESGKMYNEKCDIFSAGLIFYILFHGKSPFESVNCKDVLLETLHKVINFQQLLDNGHDESAIDLMRKMLDKNPDTRISANEALKHQYFSAPSVSMECIDEVKENIQIYNKYYKKDFDSLLNQWLIRPGMENINQKNIDSLLFFNKIGVNGKIQTIEKMSRDSNLSIKLDSTLKLQRSLSASKACKINTKSGEMNKILINSCSSHLKPGANNIFFACNYIDLLGENKKSSGNNLLKNEQKTNENDISSNNIDENKTNGKLDDLQIKHDFNELIQNNMN